ncbi:thioesterase [Virgibacillus sp. 179-BFC.A HS]|uniref:Thioesterase n=1 Tax=Tigheibacillus jepli TaxID=3035914 RepID=A0ABU5CF08_9BACI|nr:acyl-ACP thioesterase domain-containing protein [Virgibacillus sp. 179-BFC.A HS]MDY0404916.1 thioesterase [Virgibacillus sp. 179-BFC.A HS]
MASEKLGFGIEQLGENGIAWILMKIRVDIQRNPKVGETITIETWPQEPGRIEYGRDFIVRDEQNHILIKAISSWVVMDLRQRKIRRSSSVPIHFSAVDNRRAIEAKLGKLKAAGTLETAYQKMIGYSDIDFNGHLNNSRYVDYVMDCFALQEHQKYHITSIEVHFTNEVLPGEVIELKKDTSAAQENGVYIEGINTNTNKVVFKSRLRIEAE